MAFHTADYTGTIPCVLVFPALMTPAAFKGQAGAGLRYKANFLYPEGHPDIAVLQAAIGSVAAAAFPGRQMQTLKLPLSRGSALNQRRVEKGRKPYDFYEGHWVLSAQKPEKDSKGNMLATPRLVVMQNDKLVPYVDADRPAAAPFFYSGVKVVPIIQFCNFSGSDDGITAYLNRVLSFNTGNRIVTGVSDDEAFGDTSRFSEYMGSVSAHNPVPEAASGNPW